MNNLFPCPCCGNHTLEGVGEFDVCDVCMWEDDPLQREDPNDSEGSNKVSLGDYKVNWAARNILDKYHDHTQVRKTTYTAVAV